MWGIRNFSDAFVLGNFWNAPKKDADLLEVETVEMCQLIIDQCNKSKGSN